MKAIEKALKELKLSVYIVGLVSIFVDSLIVLLIFVLLLMIFAFHWVYAVVPFLGFLTYRLFKFYHSRLLKNVEAKVPDLREALRTSAEHKKSDSDFVQMLHEDVVDNLRKVKMSYFLNFSDLFLRLVVLCSISFLIVLVGVVNVEFQGFDNFANEFNIPFISDDEIEVEDMELENVEGDTNIYGDARLAELSLDRLDLEMEPIESDININDISEVSKKDFAPPMFPREIYTRYDVSFNERLPKENQRIIKRYFSKITG